jgi:predicted transcriptional regulator
MTAVKVAKKLDPDSHFHPTAFNNRLQELMRLGLVRRERQGRNWFYFREPEKFPI